jgi:hypothetical protein
MTAKRLVLFVWVLLLPMAKAPGESGLKTEGGPLNIRLVGVVPDGGERIYDVEGKKTGRTLGPIDVWESPWGSKKQRRDFIFELPASSNQVLFDSLHYICPAGIGRKLGCSLGGSYGQNNGRRLFLLIAKFPRAYRRKAAFIFTRRTPVRKVDLTLRYYCGPPREPLCIFTGPFKAGEKVTAGGGLAYGLTPEKVDLPQSEIYRFHFNNLEFDSDSPILVYDIAGKRHLVTTVTRSFCEIHNLPLDKITAITLGEKPHERIFRNIVVDYPDQPVRDYPGYLDELAERLGAAALSEEKLAQYSFSDPREAITVIDIIRGRWLTMWALEALIFSKPTVDISTLDQKDQDRIRHTANVWAGGIDLRIRARGIQLGLVGKWPEFLEQALGMLSADYEDLTSDEVRLLKRELGRIALILMNRYRQQLTPQQLEELKEYQNGHRDLPILSSYSLRKTQRPSVQVEGVKDLLNSAKSHTKRYVVEGFELEAGIIPDKPEIILGEPLFITFSVTNKGDKPYKFTTGGAQRGSVRDNNFRITACDANGQTVKDPYSYSNWGGPMGAKTLEKGCSYTKRLFLGHWCNFEKPGRYVVSCKRTLTNLFDRGKQTKLPIDVSFTLKVGPHSKDKMRRIITGLGEKLCGPDEQSLMEATLALSEIDDEDVVELLAWSLTRGGWQNKNPAINGLSRFSSGEALIIGALKDSDSSIRAHAADVLGKMKSKEAIHNLNATLKDENYSVRQVAARALGNIGDKAAVGHLKQCVYDEDMNVRLEVIMALQKLGEPFQEKLVVPVILSKEGNAFQSAIWFVRRNAGEEAVPILIRCLDMDDPSVSNYYNYTLVWQIRACGGPNLKYHHDFDEKGAEQQVEENKKTLKVLKDWLKAYVPKIVTGRGKD